MGEEVLANSKACIEANHLTQDEMQSLREAVDKSKHVPSNNMQCYVKCTMKANGVLNATTNEINVDRIVEVSASRGPSGAVSREIAEKCKGRNEGSDDCDMLWKVFACFWEK